jgi:hypothetical protein
VARYSQNKNDFLNFKKYIYAFNRLIVFPNFLIGKRTSDISQVISYFTFNNFSLTTQYYDGTDQTKASAFLQRHNFEDSKGRYILNFDTPEISAIDNISFKYKSLYFDLKKRIVDDKIFCFPKINNISKNFSFKDENQYIFPTLPDTLGIIDTTTDFLNLDISSPDIFKYLVFIPAENIDTFNDLFNLFLNQNSNVFNSSMLQELREKIDPYFAQNTFIKLSMHLVGEFADDKYKITKINHIDFFNIYGSEATINIVFNYSQGNLVKKFNFAIKTALYSKINNNKCHTQIAI